MIFFNGKYETPKGSTTPQRYKGGGGQTPKLLGWLAQHYETASIYLLVTAIIVIILVTIGIIFVNKNAYRKIRELKEL